MDLPREILDLMINQRVTVELIFEVNEIRIDEHEYDDSVGGEVKSINVKNKYGGGGLDPVVERGVRALKTLTHGTMG